MRLNSEQRRRLGNILDCMKKAQRFILDDNTKVCRKYGNELQPINKLIGSELCYLYIAIHELETMLNTKP